MKTILEIRDYLKNKFETLLPGYLSSANLNGFQDYLDTPPNDGRKRQCGIYYSAGESDHEEESEIFIIHGQLPGEIKGTEYISAIKEFIQAEIDADDVNAQNLIIPARMWVPGEPPSGGGGSFAYFELEFNGSLDDCD
jgi:hypothetical protein